MKLLEYEGKDVFARYGIPMQKRCGIIRIGDSTDKLDLNGTGP